MPTPIDKAKTNLTLKVEEHIESDLIKVYDNEKLIYTFKNSGSQFRYKGNDYCLTTPYSDLPAVKRYTLFIMKKIYEVD